jgi:hypothetical protein
MTALSLALVAERWTDVQPHVRAAHYQRLQPAPRTRAIGAGHPFELDARDHGLLPVIWLRQDPTP